MKKLITYTSIIAFVLIIITGYSQNKPVEWIQQFASSNNQYIYSIVTDNANAIFVRGSFSSTITIDDSVIVNKNEGQSFLAKLNSYGNLIWFRQFDDEICLYPNRSQLTIDEEGNICIIGGSYTDISIDDTTLSFDGYGHYLAKFNTSGELLWMTNNQGNLNTTSGDTAYAITTDNSNNILIIGNKVDSAFVSKYNSEGELIWYKNIAGHFFEPDLITDYHNNILIYGAAYSTIEVNDSVFNDVLEDRLFIKFSADGDILWRKSFSMDITSISTSIDSSYYITFYGNYEEAFRGILKLNYDGNVDWYYDIGFYKAVSCTDDDFVYITGYRQTTGNYEIIKYSLMGELIWENDLIIEGSIDFRGIFKADNDYFYFVGNFYSDLIINETTLTSTGGYDGLLFKATGNEFVYYQDICMVSVAADAGKNMIIWEKPIGQNVVSYNIYKESIEAGVYTLLDNVDYAEPGIYTDQSSNPLQNSDKYRIASVNENNYEAELSLAHKTVHLTANLGVNREVNLIWSPYEGFEVPTYNIWRSSANGEFMMIGSVPGNSFAFSDLSPPSGQLQYNIEAINPDPCEIVKNSKEIYASSISNTIDIESTNTKDITLLENLSTYPNPGKGIITVSLESTEIQKINIQIATLHGQELFEKTIFDQNIINESFDLSCYNPGIYILKIATEKQVFVKKIILN